MIGRAISHYRVVGTLGSGGMGVVYLAEDERLGRQVALKFLPANSVSSRQALDRFRIEARAASSLSHPGICAIYDIGEDGGSPYIVMEALKGESLRDRINRGPVKVVDLLDIGIQLADALDAAHSQGIVHRDIKPSNIFVGDKNRVKILDFGLAKLAQSPAPLSSGAATRVLDASTQRDLTIPGSALGTVSYMSPEQARGEDVDSRTDLFSLGIVMYEMATGIQAFGGSTPAVVFDAILNRTPPAISHLNPRIPPRLEAVIASALEKDRALRHQHASDLEADLKRIRRDLESGSLVAHSQAGGAAATVERPSESATVLPVAPTKPRLSWRHGTSASAVIVLAAIAFYFWSGSSRVAVTPVADSASGGSAPVAGRAPATTPTAPEPTTPSTIPPARPQDAVTVQAGRAAQLPQPSKPSAAPIRPPTSQGAATTGAGRASEAGERSLDTPQPGVTPAPAPAPGPAVSTSPPANDNATAPPRPAVEPPAVQPAPRAAASAPAPATLPPTSPVESDDATIRGVLRTYERAIETKSVELFRSVRPSLSAVEEARLRDSFRQVDSQQVDIIVEELRIDGRTATVRLSRRDTVVSGGRRQTESSRQTLRLEKTAAGWVITQIGR